MSRRIPTRRFALAPSLLVAAGARAQDPPRDGAPRNEPPRLLTEREVANAAAFATLAGSVRWFYPGDEAAGTDWDAFTVSGLRAVLDATTVPDLADELARRFAGVAPGVRSWAGGRPRREYDPAILVPEGVEPQGVVAWRHFGFAPPGTRHVYRSERVRVPWSEAATARSIAPYGSVVPATSDAGSGWSSRSSSPAMRMAPFRARPRKLRAPPLPLPVRTTCTRGSLPWRPCGASCVTSTRTSTHTSRRWASTGTRSSPSPWRAPRSTGIRSSTSRHCGG